MTHTLPIFIGPMLSLPADLPPSLRAALCKSATRANPVYADAVRHNRRTHGLEPELEFYETSADGALLLPRGLRDKVDEIVRAHGLCPQWIDQTQNGAPVPFKTHLDLDAEQERVVHEMLTQDMGVLCAPPGFGKTIAALHLVARRGRRALWIVNSKELARQTIAQATKVLGLDEREIGLVGNGQRRLGEHVTVALAQTLARGIPPALLDVGMVVFDEAHHVPARTVAGVLGQFPARFIVGLTATPDRADGLADAISFFAGPIRARVNRANLPGRIMQPVVCRTPTGIEAWGGGFADVIDRLVANDKRNQLIVGDVARAAAKGRASIVLTDRVEHAIALTDRLQAAGATAAVLHGKIAPQERARVIDALERGEIGVIVATGKLLGEGFDCPRLDTLFLTLPMSDASRVEQYVGRVSRTAPGKGDAYVLDYTDDGALAASMWNKREATYERMGVKVSEAARR